MLRIMPLALFSLGVMLSFALPQRGDVWLWISLWIVLLGLAVFAHFSCRKWLFQAAFYLICALFGATYGVARTQIALNQQWQASKMGESVRLRVTVVGLPERDEHGRTQFIGVAQTESGKTHRLQFRDYNAQRTWQVGDVWQMQTKIRPSIGAHNAVGFDREAWALANGIDGLANVPKNAQKLPENRFSWFNFNVLRAKISQNWQSASKPYPQGVALMQALAVGNRGGLQPEHWAAFRPLGLNHLISISGLHISMVGLLAAWLASKIAFYLPVRVARPRVLVLAVGGFFAFVYTGLAGFEVPALRSLLMLSLFAWAWAFRSDWGAWRIWWLALTGVLLFQPAAVLSVGFWLSFGLVGGLLWTFVARLQPQRQSRLKNKIHALKQAIIAQWAATLLGGIMTIYGFGALAVYSPLVNAVAIPVFSWLLVPIALGVSVLPFEWAIHAAAALGEWVMNALMWLGFRLPEWYFAHAPFPLFLLAILATLVLLLPQGLRLKPLAVVAIIAFAVYRPPVSGSLKMHVFDVGQGLAVLLQTPQHNVLFDTATAAAASTQLLPNLHALGVKRLDALIVSHHDDDHAGGLPIVQKQLPIKNLYAGQPEFYRHAQHCTGGTHFKMDNVIFEWLTPPPEQMGDDDNEKSCVLRVVSGSPNHITQMVATQTVLIGANDNLGGKLVFQAK
ncbi:DNA internalization-related competence protein ComEC/Rec2 [Alysiella filiformis]|uniref:Competence protein ComEC n=1 Tax=Alysiella filiformis DSM 16848 TaxID=1120981 RepID=A0A286E2C4_9NEIS|nr:DNA internalization-related competence protein ComEC/Rec2 [Alysiella filiformis]QMT30881.1 DNA internalization-related competence protein ComEC/Rec2 [Alysiella filiformis]UBQ56134.1 DNA internalization-related competence protein ComEC/Rec2 [Alysiella filiformis DSM 16848]SOD65045.1 competence protein ComEC [Alysiella filiformis DSM 16848]